MFYMFVLTGQTEKTLRDQEELIKRLKARIEILEQLNKDYSQYKVATEQGTRYSPSIVCKSGGLTSWDRTNLSNQNDHRPLFLLEPFVIAELAEMSDALKAQNKNLEDLVYKLNKEVSYCQTHHQLVKDPNGNQFSGLPGDAPTPAWMVCL